MRRLVQMALLLPVAALVGCGDGGGSQAGNGAPAAPKTAAAARATLVQFAQFYKASNFKAACNLATTTEQEYLSGTATAGDCARNLKLSRSYAGDAGANKAIRLSRAAKVVVTGNLAKSRHLFDPGPTYCGYIGGHWLIVAGPHDSAVTLD